MLIDVLISALIANDDDSHRCFLKSRRECFYPVVLVANKSNSGDATLDRSPKAGTPEPLGSSLRNSQKGAFIGKLQTMVTPGTKHH